MIEIFDDIPEIVKHQAEAVFKIALLQKDVPSVVQLLNDYVNSCIDEEEQEFINFYFQMKFEELKQ